MILVKVAKKKKEKKILNPLKEQALDSLFSNAFVTIDRE